MADVGLEVPQPAAIAGDAVRCGVDVVSIERIEGTLAEFGESFKDRVFRAFEQEYCDHQADPPQHYAARWAVKEAFVKAIATETQPVPFQDIGVARDGADPSLALTGRAPTAVAQTMNPDTTETVDTAVSLSHDRHADRAVGQVVFVRRQQA